MKPFNIERALAGDPVVTRCGDPVFDLSRPPNATGRYVLVGVHNGYIETWTLDGRYNSAGNETRLDLFMATKKKEVWARAIRFTSEPDQIAVRWWIGGADDCPIEGYKDEWLGAAVKVGEYEE